jgi:hypothetical protein
LVPWETCEQQQDFYKDGLEVESYNDEWGGLQRRMELNHHRINIFLVFFVAKIDLARTQSTNDAAELPDSKREQTQERGGTGTLKQRTWEE